MFTDHNNLVLIFYAERYTDRTKKTVVKWYKDGNLFFLVSIT